jgi:imidazolonepropionase-like amidohydrolase
VKDLRYLRAGTLIDGLADAPAEDAAIAIDGTRICWVGRWNDLEIRLPDSEYADLSRFTVLPGLIDAHTHITLFGDGRTYEQMVPERDEMMLLAGAANASRHLRAGVTTARDNGSRNSLAIVLKEAINRGLIEGPRLLASGRPVTSPRGHFFWCNGEADGEEEIRRAVTRLAEEGADHIKIMASGGGTQSTDPRVATYSVAELRSAVETAHSLNRLTTAHCRALESMRRAVDAGVDCMEHAEFLRPDGRMIFDEATADRLREAGTYISPTLSAWHWDTILRLRRKLEDGSATAEDKARLGELEHDIERVLANFERMLGAGLAGQVVGGTDAGCFDVTFGHLDYCLELMVRGGMTEMQALQACTSVSARAIGLEASVGCIAQGATADLVVLAGNPLVSIRAVSDVVGVCKEGRWVLRRVPELAAVA